tara:strand:- start:221 stop:400 length:180 start_codon:yes stop_codon:yes gene_type:complete
MSRTGPSEFLRYHYGGNEAESNPASMTDLEILRSDIDRLHTKIDAVTELLVEIKKLNTL